MKAFEKWNKKYKLNDLSLSDVYTAKWNSIERQKGWKGALEFIYGKLGYSEEHKEIKDFIEKELED